LKDGCGVVGVSIDSQEESAALYIYYALYALQHRGQESAGIATFDGERAHIIKEMGLA